MVFFFSNQSGVHCKFSDTVESAVVFFSDLNGDWPFIPGPLVLSTGDLCKKGS